jgi:hypothetical protein
MHSDSKKINPLTSKIQNYISDTSLSFKLPLRFFYTELRALHGSLLLPLIFCLCSLHSQGKQDIAHFNPQYVDSMLTQHTDSARWSALVANQDIYRPASAAAVIQQPRVPSKSPSLLFAVGIVLVVMLLLRLLFSDFVQAMSEGVLQMKKFFVHFKSNKYDSLLAVLSVYLIKIVLLALVVYTFILLYRRDAFTRFDTGLFVVIVSRLLLFFLAKNLLEYLFNSVIRTQEIFRAFFLQNLFSELLMNTGMAVLLLVFTYNSSLPVVLLYVLTGGIVFIFVVFNIVRSYQLMYNIRINYRLHFFMYICAFKIIPMLVLARYILNNLVA